MHLVTKTFPDDGIVRKGNRGMKKWPFIFMWEGEVHVCYLE